MKSKLRGHIDWVGIVLIICITIIITSCTYNITKTRQIELESSHCECNVEK